MIERLITVKKAAEILDVDEETFREWISPGGPCETMTSFVFPDGKMRIPEDEIKGMLITSATNQLS